MPQADGHSIIVTGPTLSEAFKRVRQKFGPEAVISGSRTGSRPKKDGWGTEQVIEVMVETASSPSPDAHTLTENLTGEIRHEVERLERMVQDICRTGSTPSKDEPLGAGNPLAEHLVENGASQRAVDRLLTRYSSETGRQREDRPGAIAWLTDYLCTGKTDFANWEGNHAFLGEHASDRLGLVLHLANCFTVAGRRVLVVSVLPDSESDEPRLKKRAAVSGHDAAVVRDVSQLQEMESHLPGYDLVLLDLPALTDHRLAEGAPIHRWLATNEKFHRHLLMPMDRDFLDLDDLRSAARFWNCDWLTLTRLDGTRRSAKLLDLIDGIPLPISFMAENTMGEGLLACATPELLLDRILAVNPASGFMPGVEAVDC